MAAADEADPDYRRCVDLLERHPGPLVTNAVVVAETGWLIERQLGPTAEAGFYRSIAAGDLAVHRLTAANWQRVAELVERYADLRLGGVDASVVVVGRVPAIDPDRHLGPPGFQRRPPSARRSVRTAPVIATGIAGRVSGV